MQEENEDLEEEITHLIRNFKRFLKKKVRATSSIRQQEDDEGKEIERDLKIKEKNDNSSDKIQCYKCKGFGQVMHECPTKDRDQVQFSLQTI